MFNVVDQNWIRSNLYQLETFDREDKHYHWREEYEQRRRSKWDFKATQSMATAYLSLSQWTQIKDGEPGPLSLLLVHLLDTKNRCAAYLNRPRSISCGTNIVLLPQPLQRKTNVDVRPCLDSIYDGQPLAVFSNHTSTSCCAQQIIDSLHVLSLPRLSLARYRFNNKTLVEWWSPARKDERTRDKSVFSRVLREWHER